MANMEKFSELLNLPNTDPVFVNLIMDTILSDKPDINFKEIGKIYKPYSNKFFLPYSNH